MKRHVRRRAVPPARAAAPLPPPLDKPSPADQTDNGPVESFTLLIVGNMNPAIHHPSWYQMTGVMHAEEAEFAQAKPLVCTSALSQFGIKDIEILCVAQRWGATTRDASQIDRIRQIASKIFELLTQTPLSSYSLIFHQHRLFVRDVGPFLASLVERLPIGFATPGGRRAASVRQVIYESNREVQTAVEPSVRRNDLIFVGVAFAHDLRGQKSHFDLGPLLSASFQHDTEEARRMTNDILQTPTAEAEK